MKKVVFAAMIAATMLPGRAQLFSSQSIGGALVGGMAGGLIGGHRHFGEGVAMGAGTGLVLGALTSAYSRRYDRPASPSYYEAGPNYAAGGMVLGGIAGGVIGGASHHVGAGIAVGASAGLLLGGLAEAEAQRRALLVPAYYPAPAYVAAAAPVDVLASTSDGQESAQPDRGSAVGSTSSAMSGANTLFGR